MRLTRHLFLSWFLFAAYLGIAILGEGLHALVPEGEHHHHHGIYVARHACNGECHDHDAHDGGEYGEPAHAALTATDSDADSHLCEICAFLFQAISQPAEVAALIEWEPLVARVHAAPQPFYSLVSLGLQAARGPPMVAT